MAFFAFSMAASRVLPCPDILVPVTAHFQRWRSMPCTMEYSIPRYSIAIAFACRHLVARPRLSTAPRPLGGMGLGREPCRAAQ
jgi:hypothetical protein